MLNECILYYIVRTKQPLPRRSRGGRVPVWSDKPKVVRKTAPSTNGGKVYVSDVDDEETDTDIESAIAAVAAANALHANQAHRNENIKHGDEK